VLFAVGLPFVPLSEIAQLTVRRLAKTPSLHVPRITDD
jgi:hypothetical protein